LSNFGCVGCPVRVALGRTIRVSTGRLVDDKGQLLRGTALGFFVAVQVGDLSGALQATDEVLVHDLRVRLAVVVGVSKRGRKLG